MRTGITISLCLSDRERLDGIRKGRHFPWF
jgi:hypothetical protein